MISYALLLIAIIGTFAMSWFVDRSRHEPFTLRRASYEDIMRAFQSESETTWLEVIARHHIGGAAETQKLADGTYRHVFRVAE